MYRFRGVGLRAAATVAALLLTTGLTAAVMPAAAVTSVREVYMIPAYGASAGTFTILGRGNGHGHGLSQYGARGAAQRSKTSAQILSFYYPGTTLAIKPKETSVRVALQAVPRDVLPVAATPNLVVRDLGARNASAALPMTMKGKPIAQWRLGVNSVGKTLVSYLPAKTATNRNPVWTSYRTLAGVGEFLETKLGYLTLTSPIATRYRGILRAASSKSGDLHRYAVNVVGLESYLKGVVASEMPSSWPAAALQAQAIAARTYTLFEVASHASGYYDICDTTVCQVYRGVDAETAATNKAISATANKYLAYGGKPIFAQFSSSNGGWESAYPFPGFPYLASQVDPYTPTAEQVYSRPYAWSKSVSAAVIQRAYPQVGIVRSITVTSREGGTGAVWRGRILRLTVTGSAGSVSISGPAFAGLFKLPSTWITFTTTT